VYIETHLDQKISLEHLARMAMQDKYSFAKKFRVVTSMSPMNYVLMKRAFAAKNLIEANSVLIDVAYQLGFYDPAHFSRTFKRFLGMSPRQYQRTLQ